MAGKTNLGLTQWEGNDIPRWGEGSGDVSPSYNKDMRIIDKAIADVREDLTTEIGGQISNIKIKSSNINPGAIETQHLSSPVVSGNNIYNGVVSGQHIASGTITGNKIATGTIVGGPNGQLYIGTGNYGTITGGPSGNIASGTITANNLADGAVGAASVTKNTIEGGSLGHITSGTITYLNMSSSGIANANITSKLSLVTGTFTKNDLVNRADKGTDIEEGVIYKPNADSDYYLFRKLNGISGSIYSIGSSPSGYLGITGDKIATGTITSSHFAAPPVILGPSYVASGNVSGEAKDGTTSEVSGRIGSGAIKVPYNATIFFMGSINLEPLTIGSGITWTLAMHASGETANQFIVGSYSSHSFSSNSLGLNFNLPVIAQYDLEADKNYIFRFFIDCDSGNLGARIIGGGTSKGYSKIYSTIYPKYPT